MSDFPRPYPLVAISILNWNGWRDTLQCLESVQRLDYPNYLVVVADNGSSNGSADKIKAWGEEKLGSGYVIADYSREIALVGGTPKAEQALNDTPSSARMVLIRNGQNLGFSGGCNVAIHYALKRSSSADFVFQLNNDATVNRDCLNVLVDVAERTGAGVVGPMIMDAAGANPLFPGLQSAGRWLFTSPYTATCRLLNSFLPKYEPYPETMEDFWYAPAAHGEGMMIRREALLEVFMKRLEYLNTSLFMYLDEFDFHFRLQKLGYQTVIAKNAVVFHKVGKSSGNHRLRVAYYFYRNQISLANLVLPIPMRIVFHLANLSLLPARIVKQVLGGRVPLARTMLAAQVDGYRGVMGKWKYHDDSTIFKTNLIRTLKAEQNDL